MVFTQPAPGAAPEDRMAELHRQLGAARAELRSERRAFDLQCRDEVAALAAARNDAEGAEREAVEERQRLQLLKRRLLRRWNERWSAEKKKIADEEARLSDERKLIEERDRLFEDRRARYAVESATEKAAIQKGWEALNAEEQDWRVRWMATEAAHRERERELGEYAGHIAAMEQSWNERAAALRNACAERADELAGLERRIAALRLQLPAPARAVETAEPPESAPEIPGTIHRRGLRLFQAREEWREEQIELFGEMETLGEALREREEAIARREAELQQAERDVRHERKYLASLEAGAKGREFLGLADTLTLRAEVRHLHRVRKAARSDATRIRDLWLERASAGEEILRHEQGRCMALLERWTAACKDCEAQAARQQDAGLTLHRQALAVAKARLDLTSVPADPAVARKRIELHERRLQRAFDRARYDLAFRRQELMALLDELRECEVRVETRSLELLRDTAAVHRELAARERVVERAEALQFEATSRREFLEGMLVRQGNTIGKLHSEIERFSRLLYEEDAAGQSRAA